MPYSTTAELPAEIKKQYSDKAQAAFIAAFNNVLKQTGDEERAFAAAHNAAKKVDGKEPVKEAVSQEVEFTLDAHFTEAPKYDEDSNVYTIPVTLIKPGMSKNKVHYSKGWLSKFADLMEGKKAYLDHEKKSEIKDRNSRSVKDVAGWYSGVHQSDDGSVKGMLNLVETPVTEHVIKMAKANPELVGLSINARGKASRGKIDGETAMIAETVEKVYSTDIVTEAAAGGEMEAMRLVASEDLENEPESDKPTTELKGGQMAELTSEDILWIVAEREEKARLDGVSKGRTEGRDEMKRLAEWLAAEKLTESYLEAERTDILKDIPDNVKDKVKDMDNATTVKFIESLKSVLPEKPGKSGEPAEKPGPGEEGYKRHFF